MNSPRSSLTRRLGAALEIAGIAGFLLCGAATIWRSWPMSVVPEASASLWTLGFAVLGATGAALGAKAAKADRA